MKSYLFAQGMNKCYPFRMKGSKSFIGASCHSYWNRQSIKGDNHALAVMLFNTIFIDW